ncbi:plant UBX domain-containing protein 1 isoform X4 [Brassica napus]|uniref:plant UBX domain-containing protein 1 isoform X4 n=1 Tax=Brassica napus TaxID=3708 RepID=UPI002078A9F1|nr:plant UBX domain-containing protein 1 isoform X4 [Brassica napus]
MFVDDPTLLTSKRRRLSINDSMEASSSSSSSSQEVAGGIREKYGREIRVFETSSISQRPSQASVAQESDEFYELTPTDYYRLVASKKEDKSLKTRKLREAEEAARRAKLTKAVIRVRFPDNHTLEATFHPSEKIQCLIDLVKRALAQPDIPFYLYTTPPKKQLKDFSQDFYSAGFIPGAIVYFANEQPKDDSASSTPYLNEEILSLKDVEVMTKAEEPVEPSSEPAESDTGTVPVDQEPKPAEKKSSKPKWFKM